MRTLTRFRLTFLVALATALPLVFPLFPGLPRWARGLIAIAVVVFAGWREYLQSVKPYLDFTERRSHFFELACADAFDRLRQIDSTVRLSIMELNWRLPWKKWGRFHMVYQLGMENAPDADLNLRADQGVRGVSGEAAHVRDVCIANLEDANSPSYRLTEEQRNKMKDLTLVFSVPIRKLKRGRDGQLYPTNEVIGTVNIDSKQSGALPFYRNNAVQGGEPTLQGEVLKALREMSVVCSRIMN
jgi:hypothetical protein